MLHRHTLAAAAALVALGASIATAQDTTRTRPTSTKRIPVTKESHGEVVPPKVDTVTLYRTDTLTMPGRTDTVTQTVTNTVMRTDTVTQMIPMRLREIGGFYFGVGGGSSLPGANFNDSDHPGWRVEGMMGIDPVGSPLGFRVGAGYSRYEPHSWVSNLLANAQMFNADADLKLHLLSGTPAGLHVKLYSVGGVSYNRYRDILENNHGMLSVGDNTGGVSSLPSTADHNWHSGWGYNAGVGTEIGHGITNLFIESRMVRFSGENSTLTHFPVVVGLAWY